MRSRCLVWVEDLAGKIVLNVATNVATEVARPVAGSCGSADARLGTLVPTTLPSSRWYALVVVVRGANGKWLASDKTPFYRL